MNLQVYCVRDRATDQFGTPMFLLSDGHAIRSFTDEVNNPEKGNIMYAHPEDYDLYFLGVYDTSTGMFQTANPHMIAVGKSAAIRS